MIFKRNFRSGFAVCAALFSGINASAQAPATVTITTNTLPGKGMVYLTVFGSEKGFPDDTKRAVQALRIPLQQQKGKTSFNLPPGRYAIAAYYDANNDGRMNKNVFGAPSEPYGFSNKVRARFSAPSFGEAAFTVAGTTAVVLDLK